MKSFTYNILETNVVSLEVKNERTRVLTYRSVCVNIRMRFFGILSHSMHKYRTMVVALILFTVSLPDELYVNFILSVNKIRTHIM